MGMAPSSSSAAGMGVPSPQSYLLHVYLSAWTLTSCTALLPSRCRSAPTTMSTDDAPILQGHTRSTFAFVEMDRQAGVRIILFPTF